MNKFRFEIQNQSVVVDYLGTYEAAGFEEAKECLAKAGGYQTFDEYCAGEGVNPRSIQITKVSS